VPSCVSICNDFGEGRRIFGSQTVTVEQCGLQSGSPALQLLGVAASCISKCALSAGALGRNCHLLPHCQPQRGYASFADSQPPALITRLDSLPGAARPVLAHRSPQPGCSACWGGWSRGTPCKLPPCTHPCPRASLRVSEHSGRLLSWSPAPSSHWSPTLPGMVLGCSWGGWWVLAVRAHGVAIIQARCWGASGLAASPGIPLGIAH